MSNLDIKLCGKTSGGKCVIQVENNSINSTDNIYSAVERQLKVISSDLTKINVGFVMVCKPKYLFRRNK